MKSQGLVLTLATLAITATVFLSQTTAGSLIAEKARPWIPRWRWSGKKKTATNDEIAVDDVADPMAGSVPDTGDDYSGLINADTSKDATLASSASADPGSSVSGDGCFSDGQTSGDVSTEFGASSSSAASSPTAAASPAELASLASSVSGDGSVSDGSFQTIASSSAASPSTGSLTEIDISDDVFVSQTAGDLQIVRCSLASSSSASPRISERLICWMNRFRMKIRAGMITILFEARYSTKGVSYLIAVLVRGGEEQQHEPYFWAIEPALVVLDSTLRLEVLPDRFFIGGPAFSVRRRDYLVIGPLSSSIDQLQVSIKVIFNVIAVLDPEDWEYNFPPTKCCLYLHVEEPFMFRNGALDQPLDMEVDMLQLYTAAVGARSYDLGWVTRMVPDRRRAYTVTLLCPLDCRTQIIGEDEAYLMHNL